MHASVLRVSALVAGVAAVLSCDGGPMQTKFGNGIAGGPTGNAPVSPPAPGSPDSSRPFVRIDTPVATPPQLINVGDSILVVTRLIDDRKIGTLTITGIKYVGTASLGTLQEIQRYPAITAPVAGTTFRPGLTDTTLRRYLKAATPVDTAVDSLVIVAVLQDSAGNADTTRRSIQLVTGPKVTITAPIANDSSARGIPMSVSATADHPTGVDSLIITVQGESRWSTPLNDTLRMKFAAGTRSGVLNGTSTIPLNAPGRGVVTINARAVDINGNPGSAPPIIHFARATGSVSPRVYQTVPEKMEHLGDSITVAVTADGVKNVGRIILNAAGDTINKFDSAFVAPFAANRTVKLPLNLTLSHQGTEITIVSYAIDTLNVTGYSLAPGTSLPITVGANAYRNSALVTYGRTFALPRAGTAGDIAVDETRGNVFVSNTSNNLLEVWNNTTKAFATNGVQVGAQPWGLFVAFSGSNRDTLLVGNSGSTTISKVDMAPTTPVEVLSKRIRTRNTVNFEVTFSVDANTGRVLIVWDGKINSYSDRPQYVAQSAGGRIFYSSRPTDVKTPGTVRWLDPALTSPDVRQIWSYYRGNGSETEKYVIFHVDSIKVAKAAAGTVVSDTLYVCDHPYGQPAGDFCVRGTTQGAAFAAARALGSDIEMVLGLDLASLALTDTNFVAASGDRNWIAFGEGNAAKVTGTVLDAASTTARLFMVNDPGGLAPGFFSPAFHVDDIQENASEKVFGLALDTTGLQVLAHGNKTFVAAVDLPFHLRLDGVYDSFANGAGVAFHPRAKGTNTAASADRVGFTATTTGVIEAFDVAHYNNRGRYVTKGTLYGPLRVTPPLAGDPAGVILKLYGLSSVGLVVIDLQAADIK